MRVLITGSNGFVGLRTVAAAHERGWQVVGLGRAARPAGAVEHYVRHDLAQPLARDAVPGDVDAVIHAAALASPFARPRDFVAANVRGTRHLLAWARDRGRLPVVHVSSTSVLYRESDQLDLTERSPVTPDAQQLNAYSRSKAVAERLVADYDGPAAILRPRAVIGEGDTVLLPRILRLADKGLLPVLEPRDGPRVRVDLTDVGTVAEYLVRAVERRTHGVYNLTNAQPVELYPFALALLARVGLTPRLRRVPPSLAHTAARAGEWVCAHLLDHREPPLTTFGVSALSRSRTFDVTTTLRDLGTPAVPLELGVDRLVADWSAQRAGTNA
ncbi:NAD-dependent epimerase/dehydratase family protein [Litorihabitans aurantiacus]|uniref:NAD(P)H steroid dehydrogenase n=1 Tax=Litorihabitans aurantiacus TaxID=1930061 RepID=A0AA38CNQ6_9MICO|nr:NAD(P)-dependent oxidoreductase [Litorihabitans aurantiacus]GMA31433.1 NAD(P)H steroid dehydrogenase [Litorihabitans aurantiacus]